MTGTKSKSDACWSDKLGETLLNALTDEELARRWGVESNDGHADEAAAGGVRGELLAWARQDSEMRRWIMHAWREANDEIVSAVEHLSMDELAARCNELLDSFEPAKILLALATEDHDDGLDLAESFVAALRCERQRRTFDRTLSKLTERQPEEVPRVVKLVIFGGHPRDESRLADRFADAGPFQLRWRTFEKRHSGGAGARTIIPAMRHADAAIIVTGMASHGMASTIKSYAQNHGIPYRCMEKTTEKQLTEAITELIAELAKK